MNILVVDDQTDIREILAFAINHELKGTIVTATSGNKAVEVLKRQNFDLVICDFNMPDGNGLVVHDYIQKECPKTKFIFCSSELDEVLSKADNVYFQIKKPNIFDYIKLLKIKLEQEKIIETNPIDFTEISLHLAFDLKVLPFDLHIRLSDNNFVKFYSVNHPFTDEDLKLMEKKEISVLYVKDNDAFKIKDHLIELIKNSLEKDTDPVSSALSAHEYVTKYFKEFGHDEKVQQLAMQSLHATISLVINEKQIGDLLVKLLSQGSYPRKLYAVTVCFAATMLKPLQLLNEHTLLKMTAAIYLQDIFVDKTEYLPIFTKNEAKDIVWKSPKDEEAFYLHPVKASNFVKQSKSLPPDVDRLIIESHELPSGEGFPRGLTSSHISPLACVLILSNLLAREFLRFETVFSTVEYLEFLNRKHGLAQGNFKKTYDAALSIDFFPKE